MAKTNNQVVLILVDGMRPDGIQQCGDPYLLDLLKKGTGSLQAKTVMPSVTLPCHASLFFSVDPERHGIMTNTWVPLVRPIDSLGDAAAHAGKKAAMLYNWEELRDLNHPGNLHYCYFRRITGTPEEAMAQEREMTQAALEYLQKEEPDFLFLYLGFADEAGHNHGWMGDTYLKAVANASQCIRKLREAMPDSVQFLITADHGGHGRSHGTDTPEDMTIPILCQGSAFSAGKELSGLSIMDLAPTIADLLDFPKPDKWEGSSFLHK